MKHGELVEKAHKWATRNTGCGVVFRELYNSYGEIPDVIGFGGWHSILIECKASRSDFLADAKKSWRQEGGKAMGTFRYYCCPTGLISPAELPAKWGLIYVDEQGKPRCIVDPRKGYYLTDNPNRFDRDIEAENQFMYFALRRINVRGGLNLAYSEKQQAVFTNENTDGHQTETANH
jgi:hypothetical protein